MVKKIIYILLISSFLLFWATSCLHRDVIEEDVQTANNLQQEKEEKFYIPKDYAIVELNGKEYWQSRGNVGKYGGLLTNSTIGEGPKTFNAWNAKDNTSSTLAAVMFEGMFTTDAFTGKVIPRLAKKVDISNRKNKG